MARLGSRRVAPQMKLLSNQRMAAQGLSRAVVASPHAAAREALEGPLRRPCQDDRRAASLHQTEQSSRGTRRVGRGKGNMELKNKIKVIL